MTSEAEIEAAWQEFMNSDPRYFSKNHLKRMLEAAEGARWPQKWRHKRRGAEYQTIGTAIVQTDTALGDNDTVIVYRGEDDRLWCRREAEFHDGRFEPLPSPPDSKST